MKKHLVRIAASCNGLPPERVALIVTVAIVIGVFPIMWCPTALCIAAAFVLRMHPALLLAINQVITPLQFALILPFAKLGAWALGRGANAPFSPTGGAVILLEAAAGWTLLALPAGVGLYVTVLAILLAQARRSARE